jgi:Rhodanese-like domain
MIIDVRTDEEFNDGHVEDSLNISVSDIATVKMSFDIEEKIEVYCATGVRALAARGVLPMLISIMTESFICKIFFKDMLSSFVKRCYFSRTC